MPGFIGSAGGDQRFRSGLDWRLWWGSVGFLEYPAHGATSERQPGTSKRLCDLELSHARAECLESLHEISHKVRQLVDGLRSLQELGLTSLIDSPGPRGDAGAGAEQLVVEWRQMLMLLSVASLVLGNVAAIAQTNLKRMLAYSTISHMGFLLLGVLSGTLEGYGAAMFYVSVYVLMGLGAFGMILLMTRDGFEAEELDDLKGLSQRNPWYAFVMLLIMFSMAGVPPTIGFWAKLYVLQSIISIGFVWLAVVAVLFSLIGAFYYLRVIKLMYFDESQRDERIKPGFDCRFLMSANGIAVLALGLMPGFLLAVCESAIRLSIHLPS